MSVSLSWISEQPKLTNFWETMIKVAVEHSKYQKNQKFLIIPKKIFRHISYD